MTSLNLYISLKIGMGINAEVKRNLVVEALRRLLAWHSAFKMKSNV